jgi:hypothetical protein
MPHFNKRVRIYRPYLILYLQLYELYFDYAFYRCHVKVWCSSRSFYRQPHFYIRFGILLRDAYRCCHVIFI